MPKINVYLPDDLANAVRAAGFAVSPVCQEALAEAVRSIGAARKAVEALRDPDSDAGRLSQIGARIGSRVTPRLNDVISRVREASGSERRVETTHLLIGLVEEGENLATRLLEGLGVDLDELRNRAAESDVDEADAPGAGTDPSLWTELTVPARMAIASALEASIDLAHTYLGPEHLLLGILDLPDSGAGRVLSGFGVEKSSIRRAVVTALAGYASGRQSASAFAPVASKLDEILRRLEGVERRLGATGI